MCVDKLETEMAWVFLIYLHQSVFVPCVKTPVARYTLSVEVRYDIVWEHVDIVPCPKRLPIMPQGIACSRRHVGAWARTLSSYIPCFFAATLSDLTRFHSFVKIM